MVSCPKCHFTQPKDQFCANCGIDMLAFRPAQPPMHVRLAKNWIFQVGAFVLTLIVAIVLIRAQHRAQFAEGFAALEQVTSKHKNFLSKKPMDKKFAQTVTNEDSQNDSSAEKVETTALPSIAESTQASTTALAKVDASPTDSPSPFPTRLKLVFAELNRGTFAAILGDSRNVASFGAYFSGLLPEHDSKADLSGINILDSASDLQIKLNQPIVVFKGSRDPQLEQNMGLTTQITPTFIDDQGAHLQIEVKRTLRAPPGGGGPIVEETFQEQVVLKKDAKAYMSGLLPHRILNDEEARTLNSNPTILKVLASTDFQNSNSEFVIFIEAK